MISNQSAQSRLPQIYGKFQLEIGTYVVIPSTFEQNLEGEFLLKIFTEDEAHVT